MNYDTIFQSNGLLNDEGKKLMDEKFLPTVQELLSSMETMAQVQVMSGALSNIIGKLTTELLVSRTASLPTIAAPSSEQGRLLDPFDTAHLQAIQTKAQEALNMLSQEADKLKSKLNEIPIFNTLETNLKQFVKEQEEWLEEHFDLKDKKDKLNQ